METNEVHPANSSLCLADWENFYTKGLFGNVVAVAFQSAYHVKIHQNNIFFNFLNIIFEISTSK